MGFILKLNVDTGREDLDVIRPMVSSGLIAGFVPAKSLTDFTGNKKTLSSIGSPTITPFGAKGDSSNGYKTNIAETPEMTIIAVFRVHPSGGSFSSDISGNRFTDSDGVKGLSLSTGDSASNVVIKPASTSLKVSSGVLSPRGMDGSTIATTASNAVTPWVFASLSVGGVRISSFCSSDNVETENTNADYSYSLRSLKKADGTPIFLNVLASVLRSSDVNTEIAEILFYNRVLTKDELIEQMEYSKTYLKDLLNIDI